MSITVTIKSVYGQDRIYPVCDKAKALTKLTGNKTLSKADIETIKSIGFSVEIEPQTL
jgi:hypothetical protein